MLLFLHSVFPVHLSNSYLSLKSQLIYSFLWRPLHSLPPACDSDTSSSLSHNSLNMSISWHLSHCSYAFPCLFATLVRKLVKDRVCVSFSFASLVPSWRVWSRVCPGKFDWYVDQLIKWFLHLLSLAVVGEVTLWISSLSFLANLIERIPWLWGLDLLLGFIYSRETPKTVTCSHVSFCWGLK